MRRGNSLFATPAAAFLALALTGCAPEALNSRQATAFNGWADRIASVCRPLTIGSRDVGEALARGTLYDADFNYFFDLTSRLYYGRTTVAAYRTGVTGFFGAGADTTRSLDCIVANLPADRAQPTGAPAVRLQ